MFDYGYDDCFYKPAEIENIICEAENNIKQLFTDKIKNVISEAAEAEKKLEALNREIKKAEYKKKMIEKSLKETEEKAEKAELYDMPKKYIDKFIRNVAKNFAPNDTVYYVKAIFKDSPSEICKGDKKVIAKINGTEMEIPCPNCKGYGHNHIVHYGVEKRIISDIRLKLCFDRENRINYWNRECISLIGETSYTDVKNLFATEAEAKAEAGKRNIEKIKKGGD